MASIGDEGAVREAAGHGKLRVHRFACSQIVQIITIKQYTIAHVKQRGTENSECYYANMRFQTLVPTPGAVAETQGRHGVPPSQGRQGAPPTQDRHGAPPKSRQARCIPNPRQARRTPNPRQARRTPKSRPAYNTGCWPVPNVTWGCTVPTCVKCRVEDIWVKNVQRRRIFRGRLICGRLICGRLACGRLVCGSFRGSFRAGTGVLCKLCQ